MYVALVELEVFSGVSVFLPLASTSAPAYPLPPPTTLLGALAYPYLRIRERKEITDDGHSPTIKILDKVKYAVAGAEAYSISRDIERVYQAVYMRKTYWGVEHRDRWFTIAVRGTVSYLDNKLYLLYVSSDRNLLEYSRGIVRLGRKEAHVAVNKVVIEPIENVAESTRRVFDTIFYVPTSIAECEAASTKVLSMPKLSPKNFAFTLNPELEDFYVPRGLRPMKCELREGGSLISIDGLDIAVPSQLIRGE